MVKDSNAPTICEKGGAFMLVLLMGILSFVLFFASDYNDLRLRHKGLVFLFPAGAVLLTAATVLGCLHGTAPLSGLLGRMISGAAGIAFLLLTLHALFFAIPARASYGGPGRRRPAATSGVYGLCRHPGVLFFIPLMLCLWLSLGLPPYCAAAWSALNVLLARYEDIVVFPELLEGYDEYKTATPFLIPRIGGGAKR